MSVLCQVGSQRCPELAIRYSKTAGPPRRIAWMAESDKER